MYGRKPEVSERELWICYLLYNPSIHRRCLGRRRCKIHQGREGHLMKAEDPARRGEKKPRRQYSLVAKIRTKWSPRIILIVKDSSNEILPDIRSFSRFDEGAGPSCGGVSDDVSKDQGNVLQWAFRQGPPLASFPKRRLWLTYISHLLETLNWFPKLFIEVNPDISYQDGRLSWEYFLII